MVFDKIIRAEIRTSWSVLAKRKYRTQQPKQPYTLHNEIFYFPDFKRKAKTIHLLLTHVLNHFIEASIQENYVPSKNSNVEISMSRSAELNANGVEIAFFPEFPLIY